MVICYHWGPWCADPDVPIIADGHGGFILQIRHNISVPIGYCFHCGLGEESKCSCKGLHEWAASDDSCIHYYPQVNEFHLVCSDGAHLIMQYCPVCGGRLEPSTRSSLFAEMDEAELQEIGERLKDTSTIESVLAILGPPDETTSCDYDSQLRDHQLYGVEITRQVLRYGSIARTFEVYIQENTAEEIRILYVPHERAGGNPGAGCP